MRFEPAYRLTAPAACSRRAARRQREWRCGPGGPRSRIAALLVRLPHQEEQSMTTSATTTWFITGASSGFGMAFARYALDQGYNVVATARAVGKLDALAARAPDRVLVHKLDVTLSGDAEAAVAAAVGRFGRIDVLVNNAGYGIIGAVEGTPQAAFLALIETKFVLS